MQDILGKSWPFFSYPGIRIHGRIQKLEITDMILKKKLHQVPRWDVFVIVNSILLLNLCSLYMLNGMDKSL